MSKGALGSLSQLCYLDIVRRRVQCKNSLILVPLLSSSFLCPCCCPGLPQLRTLHVGGCAIKDKETVDTIAGGRMGGERGFPLSVPFCKGPLC